VPRNRTVRLAVLGSPVQRTAAKSSSRASSATRRRLILGLLVAASLLLVTVSFRSEGVTGPQETGAAVLRPFQIAAERISSPFRDAYGWFSGLVHAKAEAERLRRELAVTRQEAVAYKDAARRSADLEAQLNYRAPPSLAEFDSVHAAVIAYPGPFDRELVVAAGSGDGVRRDAPVMTPDGLVGRVTDVTRDSAKVQLLVDGSSSVTAEDVDSSTSARGLIRGRAGDDSVLLFDFVGIDDVVREGDRVITGGSQSAQYPSNYPRGIPIGTVTYASQSSTAFYKSIQVQPFVDFDSLESVMVLVPRSQPR
jgi:rod shape-determining protein MreC